MFSRLISFRFNSACLCFLVVAFLTLVTNVSFPDDDTTNAGKAIHPFFQKLDGDGDTGYLVRQRAESQVIAPGTRVRLTAPAPGRMSGRIWGNKDMVTVISREDESPRTFTRPGRAVTGTLVAVTDDIIVLELSKGKQNVRIPRAAIAKLEVSQTPSRKLRGAAIGAAVAVGVVVVLVAVSDDSPIVSDSTAILGGSVFFAPLGAAVGSIVAPGERWRPVAPGTVNLLRTPGPRVGLTFAIRF